MKPLSQEAVRGLMIAALGLADRPQPPATKQSLLAAIRQIHMLQLDSINVIARAPYFVLWSRVGDYDPNWLDELFLEGALFEYWSHANCLLPIEDYPFYRAGSWIIEWRKPQAWLDKHQTLAAMIMDYIREYGGARQTDFKSIDGRKGTWDNPRDEQVALDYLLYVGELMVRERVNFQRVYDLRERVYPAADQQPEVTFPEAHDQFVLYTIKALGVTQSEWIPNYFRLKSAWVNAALKRLEKQDKVARVEVDGWKKPGYVHPDNLPMVEAAADGKIPQSRTTLLSPFDPLVWADDRSMEVFNYDSKIEFYFPEAKRKYGYYSLPILYNNALVGRLDPKAHRKEGIFEVKSLHLEPGVVIDDALVLAVQGALQACANWHQTPEVIIRDTTESGLADIFRV